MEPKRIMVFGSKKDNVTLLRNWEVILHVLDKGSMESSLRQKDLLDLIMIMKFVL